MEYTVDNLFNEWSNYKSEDFDLLKEDEKNNFLNLLNGNQKNITTKCIECEKEYSFDMQHEKGCFLFRTNRIGKVQFALQSNSSVNYIELHEGIQNIYNLEYTFTCTKDINHIYKMHVTIIRHGSIFEVIKIGQYPNKEKIQGFPFDEYKKILKKYSIYIDYKNAYICNSHSFSVASYAYIRRVFEKLILAFVDKKKEITGEEPSNNRIDDKIKFVSEMFCEDVRELLKMLYAVLSKGVHELSEEDCKEYFDTLNSIIEMQLAYMEAERQKEEKKNSLSKKLNEIHNKLSKK